MDNQLHCHTVYASIMYLDTHIITVCSIHSRYMCIYAYTCIYNVNWSPWDRLIILSVVHLRACWLRQRFRRGIETVTVVRSTWLACDCVQKVKRKHPKLAKLRWIAWLSCDPWPSVAATGFHGWLLMNTAHSNYILVDYLYLWSKL